MGKLLHCSLKVNKFELNLNYTFLFGRNNDWKGNKHIISPAMD